MLVKARSSRHSPRGRPDALRKLPEAGERQGERVLGHGLPIDALGTGPNALAVEKPELGDPLDAGHGQLNPTDPGGLRQVLCQSRDILVVHPHQGVRGIGHLHQCSPTCQHRFAHES